MHCAICYHLHNLQNVKNNHGVLLLVKLQADLIKSNTPPWVFFTFFKLYKWYQIAERISSQYEALTHQRPKLPSYSNQSIDLQSKLTDYWLVSIFWDFLRYPSGPSPKCTSNITVNSIFLSPHASKNFQRKLLSRLVLFWTIGWTYFWWLASEFLKLLTSLFDHSLSLHLMICACSNLAFLKLKYYLIYTVNRLSDCNLTHNHLVCKRTLHPLAKWMSVRLRTKSLWVRVLLQSLKLQISRLDIQATIE